MQNPLTNPDKQRIVCACNRDSNGKLYLGVRHYCPAMRAAMDELMTTEQLQAEQGFIDNYGNFLTREEAFVIAEKRGQIINERPFVRGKLFSEDLY